MGGPVVFPTFGGGGAAVSFLLTDPAGAADAVGFNLLNYGSPYIPANSLVENQGMLTVSIQGDLTGPVPGELIGLYLKLFNVGAEPTNPANCLSIGSFNVPVGEDTTITTTGLIFITPGFINAKFTSIFVGATTSTVFSFLLGNAGGYPSTVDFTLPVAVKVSLNSVTNPLALPTQPNVWTVGTSSLILVS